VPHELAEDEDRGLDVEGHRVVLERAAVARPDQVADEPAAARVGVGIDVVEALLPLRGHPGREDDVGVLRAGPGPAPRRRRRGRRPPAPRCCRPRQRARWQLPRALMPAAGAGSVTRAPRWDVRQWRLSVGGGSDKSAPVRVNGLRRNLRRCVEIARTRPARARWQPRGVLARGSRGGHAGQVGHGRGPRSLDRARGRRARPRHRPQLREYLAMRIAHCPDVLALDLSDVSFCDSSGCRLWWRPCAAPGCSSGDWSSSWRRRAGFTGSRARGGRGPLRAGVPVRG
jgi:hypothetical protein